jgi:NADH-quinone oxidoreductase subunit L
MFKMGGLRQQLPVTFWSFLLGAASLAALPLVTAGFYSKDFILYEVFISEGGLWLWLAGIIGAIITAIYAFRMVFLTFFGEAKSHLDHRPGLSMKLPLVVLAVLSIIGGFIELPLTLGGLHLFSDFMEGTFGPPAEMAEPAIRTELLLQIVSAIAALAGVYIAYLFYRQRPALAEQVANSSFGKPLQRLWFIGWGFDWLYDRLFVRPYYWLAQANKSDLTDLLPTGIARLSEALYYGLSRTQTGNIRLYALVIALGAVISVGLVVLL